MADGFLGRWSRRKQDVQAGKPVQRWCEPDCNITAWFCARPNSPSDEHIVEICLIVTRHIECK